jgi:hypothetical protein
VRSLALRQVDRKNKQTNKEKIVKDGCWKAEKKSERDRDRERWVFVLFYFAKILNSGLCVRQTT